MLGHRLNVLPSQLATFIIHQQTYPGKKPLAKQVLGWFRNSTAIHSCNFPGLWEVLIGCICTAASMVLVVALPFLGPVGTEFRTNLHRFKSEVKTEPLNLLPAGEGEDAAFPLCLSRE